MLLQSDINKWRLSQFFKLDKLYINSALTRLLKISKIGLIEYNNQILPTGSRIYLRACDAESSYCCTPPITVSNILRWDCILKFCSGCPIMNAPYLESSEQLDIFFLLSFIKFNSIYFKTYINVRYTY